MGKYFQKRWVWIAVLMSMLPTEGLLVSSALFAQTTNVQRKEQKAQSLEAMLDDLEKSQGVAAIELTVFNRFLMFVAAEKPDIAPLIRKLENSQSSKVRLLLLSGLVPLKERALPALPALIKIAKQGPEKGLRSMALQVIEQIGPAAAPSVIPLRDIVQDEHDDLSIRLSAATALGAIGPSAQPAYDTIFTFLISLQTYESHSKADSFGTFLGRALREIDSSPEAEQKLFSLLDRFDGSVIRAAVARVLINRPGGLTPPIVQALIDALVKERSSEVQQTIARTLRVQPAPLTENQVEKLAKALQQAETWEKQHTLGLVLRDLGVLTHVKALEAFKVVLCKEANAKAPAVLASLLVKTGDLGAQRIVLEGFKECKSENYCRNLAYELQRAAPFKPELFMEMLELFRTSKSAVQRDQLLIPLMQADASLLPLIEQAVKEEQDIASRLLVLMYSVKKIERDQKREN